MAKLFISLYIFIALTLVSLSAILDKVFEQQAAEPSPELQQLVKILKQVKYQKIDLEHFLQQADIDFAQVPLAMFAWPSDALTALQAGEIVPLHSQDSTQLYTLASADTLYEISIHKPAPLHRNVSLYSGVFFLLLGLLIALWLWPLWRDLTAIASSLKNLNADGKLDTIKLPKRSLVSNIAEALNQMSNQVVELLARHKEMTGAVAHELRTPLARLKFALASDSPPRSDAWIAMRDDVNDLERLVQEMLDYLRTENSVPELNFSSIPFLALVEQILQRIAAHNLRKIPVTIIESDVEILGDGHFIERALENLLLNAFRYAHSHILIRTEVVNSSLLLHVEDDGEGVTDENKEKIFAPFYRPDSGRSRERGGAGLGLAIVKRIQHWHSGDCWVTDSSLGGADFILLFAPDPKQSLKTNPHRYS
ncbi:two-component sensor histidine kinase [Alteromonas pelagimontana]|uniref:histidine kinase n=1 Tax=Alteromonas pelagimontana TaxID=1858656 RepID=A0A6M4MCG5_9ALTE|nr:ATP-binding protein [Alteromonas pelagimontana]QJR80235.1 two-component sensor histidine kinase [Alteromonas pelagimontana]